MIYYSGWVPETHYGAVDRRSKSVAFRNENTQVAIDCRSKSVTFASGGEKHTPETRACRAAASTMRMNASRVAGEFGLTRAASCDERKRVESLCLYPLINCPTHLVCRARQGIFTSTRSVPVNQLPRATGSLAATSQVGGRIVRAPTLSQYGFFGGALRPSRGLSNESSG